VLLITVGVTAVSSAATQLRCIAAARDAALGQARGGNGEQDGRRTAPDGARIEVTVGGERVRAEVSTEVHPLGRRLPGIPISAVAVAAVEPGAP
jgi:hypothetical protein